MNENQPKTKIKSPKHVTFAADVKIEDGVPGNFARSASKKLVKSKSTVKNDESQEVKKQGLLQKSIGKVSKGVGEIKNKVDEKFKSEAPQPKNLSEQLEYIPELRGKLTFDQKKVEKSTGSPQALRDITSDDLHNYSKRLLQLEDFLIASLQHIETEGKSNTAEARLLKLKLREVEYLVDLVQRSITENPSDRKQLGAVLMIASKVANAELDITAAILDKATGKTESSISTADFAEKSEAIAKEFDAILQLLNAPKEQGKGSPKEKSAKQITIRERQKASDLQAEVSRVTEQVSASISSKVAKAAPSFKKNLGEMQQLIKYQDYDSGITNKLEGASFKAEQDCYKAVRQEVTDTNQKLAELSFGRHDTAFVENKTVKLFKEMEAKIFAKTDASLQTGEQEQGRAAVCLRENFSRLSKDQKTVYVVQLARLNNEILMTEQSVVKECDVLCKKAVNGNLTENSVSSYVDGDVAACEMDMKRTVQSSTEVIKDVPKVFANKKEEKRARNERVVPELDPTSKETMTSPNINKSFGLKIKEFFQGIASWVERVILHRGEQSQSKDNSIGK